MVLLAGCGGVRIELELGQVKLVLLRAGVGGLRLQLLAGCVLWSMLHGLHVTF